MPSCGTLCTWARQSGFFRSCSKISLGITFWFSLCRSAVRYDVSLMKKVYYVAIPCTNSTQRSFPFVSFHAYFKSRLRCFQSRLRLRPAATSPPACGNIVALRNSAAGFRENFPTIRRTFSYNSKNGRWHGDCCIQWHN